MTGTRCARWMHFFAWVMALAATSAVGQTTPAGNEAPRATEVKPVAADADARLFAVEIRTGPKWDAALPPPQQAWFKEHSANLRQLREAGRVVLGARYGEVGLVILSAASIEEARTLMSQDPAMAHGTFAFQVHEFNVFYPGNVPARARR